VRLVKHPVKKSDGSFTLAYQPLLEKLGDIFQLSLPRDIERNISHLPLPVTLPVKSVHHRWDTEQLKYENKNKLRNKETGISKTEEQDKASARGGGGKKPP
jgi:hypothetical protein